MEWNIVLDRHLSLSDKPLIVVLGPTASGKTDASLLYAKHIGNAEIVNADSRQLYKHLDIGTAKIRPEEMQNIPHHLIDVLDPKEEATIAWYQKEAIAIIDDSLARKKIPMLVGGSMLYISSIIDGLRPLPPASKELRAKIESEYDTDGGTSLYNELNDADPETAQAFAKANKPYVVRGIELLRSQNEKPSVLKKKRACPYDLLILGMQWNIDKLKERIDMRTKKLLDAGWIEEVEHLLAMGYLPTDPGMKSHGYREIMQWIASGEGSRDELFEVIARKTRAYAKRQITWWKMDERIQWLSPVA